MEISRIIREFYFAYNQEFDLDILLGISGIRYEDKKSRLIHFRNNGALKQIDGTNSYKPIGSGSQYTGIFMKKLWKDNMTMMDAARIGIFHN